LVARNSAQYLLPDRLDPGELGRALDPAFSVKPEGRATTGKRAFYDTFDGRLHSAGLSLVHEGERLLLLDDGGQEQACADWTSPRERLFAADLPDGRLRDLLAPVVDVRALTRIADVRAKSRLLRILDDDGKTVVRVRVEEPRALGVDGDGALQPRLGAVALRGYDKELSSVCRLLESGLGLSAATMSVSDEAVALAGGVPGGTSSKPDVELDPAERTDRGAAKVLQRLLEVIQVNLPGTLADTDSEFLHDFRVGVRRSRSVQRELRRAFPPEQLAHFRSEFRWLQAVTGPSRDLDVYVLDFDYFRATLPPERGPELEPLRKLLVRNRAKERRRMVRALRSDRTVRLFEEWAAFLSGLERMDETDRPDAATPIKRVSSARIARVYGRMVKAGNAIDDASPPEALHELRKQSKELRYLLEFFAGFYPATVIKPKVRTLKSLQDSLGRFQDRQVQADLVRSLGEDLRHVEGGTAALLAMGQLVDRLERQQAEARDEFAGRFAAFASREQRELAKETFV
jgi:CHAD domain-containing protein